MSDWIVDTNVIAAANYEATHVNDTCVKACAEFLEGLGQGKERVVIDHGGLILEEYLRHRAKGQPPVGERFVRWLLQVRADQRWCEQVTIHGTKSEAGRPSFEEFPDTDDLAGFDDDDRKFVAVANAKDSPTVIVNATDPVWSEYQDALSKEGIMVRCLCPEVVAC